MKKGGYVRVCVFTIKYLKKEEEILQYAILINLEDTMLHEIRYSQQDNYYMIPLF